MKAITIRNVEPMVSEKLKSEAKKQGKSINQFIIDMIEQNLGFKKKKKYTNIYNDLDHLFGKWTEAEFNQIQRKVDQGRKIDAEIWE